MLESRLLLVLKYVIPNEFYFYEKFLVHAFPQNFLNYILYIYTVMILNPQLPVCLFHFLFSLNSHNTKMLCTICPSMAEVCNYQCRFFLFHYYYSRLFFCFSFLLVMNDEHVYLASHKNSDRSCLHM